LLGKSIIEHRNAAQSKKTYIEGFGFV
jgi:hypothetical protein